MAEIALMIVMVVQTSIIVGAGVTALDDLVVKDHTFDIQGYE